MKGKVAWSKRERKKTSLRESWVREKMKSKIPIIVMTGYAEVQTAVSAMKLGAFEYLKKPINPSVLEEKISAALASTDEESTETFIPPQKRWVRGNSPVMQRLYKHVELVAPTSSSGFCISISPAFCLRLSSCSSSTPAR